MIDNGMTIEREATILEGAIDKWGAEMQTNVAIEEMAELTRALMRWRRARCLAQSDTDADVETWRRNIREEMADVSIVLRQLELIYGDYAEEEIEKLERLERRIKEGR